MQNNCHLAHLVYQQAKTYGDRTALMYRDYEENKWKNISWNYFSKTSRRIAMTLLKLGLKVQDNIAVFSQNKPECMFVNFGAYSVRVAAIPFYPTSSGSQVVYMMNDAEVQVLFVGEQQQYDTAISVASLCENLQKIVIFDRKVVRNQTDTISMYLDEFMKIGDDAGEDLKNEFRKRQDEADFNDIADILYTSGTTGRSKGVILTYSMYHEAMRVNDYALNFNENDVVLNFLPLTHVFERGWSYLGLTEGAVQALNLRPNDVLKSLREVRPTCMSSVPRFWEKVYQGVLEKIAESSPVQRTIMTKALKTGIHYWKEYQSKCKKAPLALQLKYKFYDKIVYSTLRRTLGLDRSNFFPTAGAQVSTEVENLIHAAGINMKVGYGLTESTATVSCDIDGMPTTPGSVGRLIDKIEIKFGENNEILLRGKTITPGYYKKKSTTEQSIDADGWFHTGDAGYLKDGELFLTERIKDLFKTSNGKYIAPQAIESKLTIDRYIEQVVVVADKRKFVSALIVPNYQLLEQFAREKGISYGSRDALCKEPSVISMISQRIDTLQQDLANYEKVKHFILLDEPLSLENGELTNTLKVKRKVVYERYAAQIENMYAEAERNFAQK